MQAFLFMDARQVEQDLFILRPPQIEPRGMIIRPVSIRQAERDHRAVGSRKELTQISGFHIAGGQEPRRARQMPSLEQEKVRPLFPPLMFPRPGLEHAVWG